jgi:hypothetical protein
MNQKIKSFFNAYLKIRTMLLLPIKSWNLNHLKIELTISKILHDKRSMELEMNKNPKQL